MVFTHFILRKEHEKKRPPRRFPVTTFLAAAALSAALSGCVGTRLESLNPWVIYERQNLRGFVGKHINEVRQHRKFRSYSMEQNASGIYYYHLSSGPLYKGETVRTGQSGYTTYYAKICENVHEYFLFATDDRGYVTGTDYQVKGTKDYC